MILPHRDSYRNVVFFAVLVAVAMIVLCVTDLLASYPYQPFMGQTTFDVTNLISSVILIYMCWHTWHDLELGDGPRRPSKVTNRSHYGRSSRSRSARHRAASGGARRGDRSGSGHRAALS